MIFNAASCRTLPQLGRCFKSQTACLCSWRSHDVRTAFIEYFKNENHTYIPSSSVLPKKGAGTYFTNAGMNQFKPLFLGEIEPSGWSPPLSRAVNSQKCIRVGGKHNDLDDVGKDLTHHTFFEMLGNWSFGDYFKVEACHMAHRLLTERLKLPLDRLYFTYFAGNSQLGLTADEEVRDIWLSLGVPQDRILPFGAADNFWEMGQTGPCGPCTEIHYDHKGEGYAGSKVNADSPDLVEIWNLVFMQYNRHEDGSLSYLPSRHVDTGMGLERITAVLCGSMDNYCTDLFLPLFDIIQKMSGCPKYQSGRSDLDIAYRTLADHARMMTVAISDGLIPSGDDLGHKLRSIIYKSIRLCHKQFDVDPKVMLPTLVSKVVETLSEAFPELAESKMVIDILCATLDHHARSYQQAQKTFHKFLKRLGSCRQISAEELLLLETGHFGSRVPLDFVTDFCQEHGLKVDTEIYQALKHQGEGQQAERLFIASDPASALVTHLSARDVHHTNDDFKYYYTTDTGQYDFSAMENAMGPCHILGVSSNGELCDVIERDDKSALVLDKTCFYAEAGGQEADSGILVSDTGQFSVSDVQTRHGYVVHYGHVVEGFLRTGQTVSASVSDIKRECLMRNHTATHLLSMALREVLSSSLQQGSHLSPYKFTFDFFSSGSYEISEVESSVRSFISMSCPVTRRTMTLTEAESLPNLITLTNERYPENVSVICIKSPDERESMSNEFCCGTHVSNTLDLTDFCILQSGSKGQNLSRLTCVTGLPAKQAHLTGQTIDSLCELLQEILKNSGKVKDVLTRTLENMTMLLSQADMWSEELDQQLQIDEANLSGVRKMYKEILADLQKTVKVLQPLHSELHKLNDPESDKILAMKNIISALNKCFHLELVPKAKRELSVATVNRLEHQVTSTANARNNTLLNQLIDQHLSGYCDEKIICVEHDLDVSSRQVEKLLSKRRDAQALMCMVRGSPSSTAVLSLPLDVWQPLSLEDINQVVQETDHLKGVTGKIRKSNKHAGLYLFTSPTEISTKDLSHSIHSVLKWR